MPLTAQQSVRIRVLAAKLQQASVSHSQADERLKEAVAEFNDYLRSLEEEK